MIVNRPAHNAHVYPSGLVAGRFSLARELHGWSCAAVGFHAHTTGAYVEKVERGATDPDPAYVVAVGRLLDFPVAFFRDPLGPTLSQPSSAIVCVRGPAPRPKRCVACFAPETHLCDHPTGEGGRTCSAPMCRAHRTEVAPGVDYCPRHARAATPSQPRLIDS